MYQYEYTLLIQSLSHSHSQNWYTSMLHMIYENISIYHTLTMLTTGIKRSEVLHTSPRTLRLSSQDHTIISSILHFIWACTHSITALKETQSIA